MFSFILIGLCCLCALSKLWLTRQSVLEPPAFSGRFPLISFGLLLIIQDVLRVIVDNLEEFLNKGIVTAYIGFKRIYVITDPEAIMKISNTCLEKEDYFYKFLKPFLGEGLVTANVSAWKNHRKLLNPAFSHTNLKSFIDSFNSQARSLTDRLDLQLGRYFTYENVLKLNNLETICLTATGVKDDKYGSREKYLSLVTKGLQCFNDGVRQPWLHCDFIFKLSVFKKEQDEVAKHFSDLSLSIIEKKKQEIKTVKTENNSSVKLKSFLDLMLEYTNETNCFTDKHIIEETNTLISTGHETVSSQLNITLIVLGSFPDVQEKVYNEIFQLVGESDKDLDINDLTKLVYIEAVIKETLRMYPVVPVIARKIGEDIQIKNYTLKANSRCILLLYGLNRHPSWGTDADQFKPERWLDTTRLPDMNHFGSFALGKRNCIGKAYALMSMKVTLAHLIRKYRVTADISKVEFKWRLTSYPASGNHFKLERRE